MSLARALVRDDIVVGRRWASLYTLEKKSKIRDEAFIRSLFRLGEALQIIEQHPA